MRTLRQVSPVGPLFLRVPTKEPSMNERLKSVEKEIIVKPGEKVAVDFLLKERK